MDAAFCRCCNCRYYDDFDSLCKLNPPVYAGKTIDEDGDRIRSWSQPVIEMAWAEWCGQWQPEDPSQTEEQRKVQILSLMEEDKRAMEG